jgi:hypothetical protein
MAKNRITFSDDFVLSNEKVGIGTTNPSATLTVIGDTNISGTINASAFAGNISLNSIHSTTTGIVTTTNNTQNQVIDSFNHTNVLSARYQVSVACTGQLAGSYESPSSVSVTALTPGQYYIPGVYYNIPLLIKSGVGTDARAIITVNGTTRTVGFTSAYNTLVTTAAHGLIGSNQPISFASSISRREYVTSIDSDVFTTPTTHGIGTSEAVTFPVNILDTDYSGIIVSAGTTYFASGTGTTTFTIQTSIGSTQVTGMGNTTYGAPGLAVSFVGFAVTAGTIYYATGTGTTTFTLSGDIIGSDPVYGIGISTNLSIGATISGGVSAVQIVFSGSGYNVGAALTASNLNLNSIVGSGFSFAVGSVFTNYQTTDILVLTSSGSAGVVTCDYMEYASIANNDVLGVFDASLSGTTAQLRFSPIYKDNTIRFVGSSILR